MFTIYCNNAFVSKSRTWNGAIRKIESLVRNIARENECYARLINSESNKSDDGLYHVSGFREWRLDNGILLNYTIEKD